MTLASPKAYPTVFKYSKAVSSAAISVVLLAFIALNSWFLFSYPIGNIIPRYLYGADDTSRLGSPFSVEGGHEVQYDHIDGSPLSESEEATKSVQYHSTKHRQRLDSSDSLVNEPVPFNSLVSEHQQVTQNPLPQSNHSSDNEAKNIAAATVSLGHNVNSECDLYHGKWYYDPVGPLYTNNTCPILTQAQNCQGNGRPDKEYENWRWRPLNCELPRFSALKFLELMNGKTIAFVGDSVARNQMESLMCILWQVEVPVNRGSRQMQRWLFKSHSVTIIRIWSAWLVHQTSEPYSYVPDGVNKIHLDVPDENVMHLVPSFDVLVLSNGHWFTKPSVYILNNEIVGTQSWSSPEHPPTKNLSNTEAFRISTETSLKALITHPNYTGLTIVTTYSPDHYENGAWNTGGSCTGKVRPLPPGQLVENAYTSIMHEKQVTGFHQAEQQFINRSKFKLMDITEAFGYRHDGHPGPFRSPDPTKTTKRGPDGRPPPQDCLHWCMPGPIDVWNELMLEIIRRDFEGPQKSS